MLGLRQEALPLHGQRTRQAVIGELGQSYKKQWEAGRYGDIIGMAAVDALTLQYALTAYSARGAKAGQVAVGAADTAGEAVEVAADRSGVARRQQPHCPRDSA